MNLRGVLLTVYMLVSAILFISFTASPWVWLSFFVNGLVLLGFTIYHLYFEKQFSPFLSAFIVFNFLFFLVAPMVQIDSFHELTKPKFANFFPYNERLTVYTNALILLFNCVFFVSYVFFKKRTTLNKNINGSHIYSIFPLTIFTVAIISLIIFFLSFDFVLIEIETPNWIEDNVSVMEYLLWKKVLFLVPFGGLLLCFQYFEKGSKNELNKLTVALIFLILLLLIFWFKNPFTEKRNALGPVYICLLFLFAPNWLNSNIKMLSFLFFSMIIIFPMTSILTHTDASFSEIYQRPEILLEEIKGGGVIKTFGTLHYDAFSNIMATLDYVGKHGFSYGYQLLSALLFFIPRSVWEAKPNSTGKLVGEYLIEDYGFNFSNLSNPLVSEGYINFGLLGVFAAAVILAYVIIKMIPWLYSASYLKKTMALYFGIHLIFLLRGDFTNGFTFYIGALIGAMAIPKITEYLIAQLVIKKKNE